VALWACDAERVTDGRCVVMAGWERTCWSSKREVTGPRYRQKPRPFWRRQARHPKHCINNLRGPTLQNSALRCLALPCFAVIRCRPILVRRARPPDSSRPSRRPSLRVFLTLFLRRFNATHSALSAGHFHLPCASDGTQEMLGYVRPAVKLSKLSMDFSSRNRWIP
jgi:hypothetical protein